jgi:ABC-2 type transport system permease protein
MRKLFKILGADWDQFRWLLGVSIRIDLRRHRGFGSPRRKISPFIWSLLFYGFISMGLSGSLVQKATPFLYSLLIFTYSMAMIIFSVLLEFGNTIVSPDDTDVLAFRPISSRTYFLAKLGNLFFYVLIMGTSLCLFPSIIGLALKGTTILFPFIFFPVAMIANLTAAAFVILVYTSLLRIMPYERFKDLLAYIQTVFVFLIFFLYQLIPRMSSNFIKQGVDVNGPWLYAAPSAWYAGSVQIILGLNGGTNIWLALLAASSTVLLFSISFRRISLQYSNKIACLQSEKKSKKDKPVSLPLHSQIHQGNRLVWKILRYPEAMAGYSFSSTMLKRDRWVKMILYPSLGFPLAFLLIAILQRDIIDPYASSLSQSNTFGMSYMVVFFVFFMIHMLITGIQYSQEWEASWIYYVVPMASPGRFYLGIQWTLFSRLLIPFFVILGIVFCTQIHWIHAIQHTFSLFILSLVLFATVLFLVKVYPFSKKREKGERTQRFSFLIVITPFFVLAILLQMFIYRNFVGWLLTQILLVFLFFILETRAVKRLNRKLRDQEF